MGSSNLVWSAHEKDGNRSCLDHGEGWPSSYEGMFEWNRGEGSHKINASGRKVGFIYSELQVTDCGAGMHFSCGPSRCLLRCMYLNTKSLGRALSALGAEW